MSSSLKQQTISGIIWSAFQKFGTLGISFVSNIILARLLSPDDYGCIGLLAIFIVIAEVFVNGGFASALIQKKNPSQKDYSTVFIWNIFVSLILYFILYLIAPYVALYYQIPLLVSVLRVQGIIIFINALSIIQLSVLRKQLQFKKLSIIQLIAAIVSVFFAIVMAFQGWGIWSLVMQQLLYGLIATVALWFTANWKPILCFSFKSFKELFGYGAFLLMSDLLNSIYENIQGLLIGKKYTSIDMGYYTQARKLETVPTQSISYVVSQVTFPVFAKLQNDKQQLYVAVRKSLRMMNYLNFPLMILLIVIAEPLFILLFSEKWIASVPYFRILCLSGIVNCLQSVNYQVVCAVGRSKEVFKWNIIKRLIGFIFIFIGLYWGISGLLYGMVCGFYFTFIVNALVATPTTGYTIYQQLKDVFPILAISVFSAVLPYLMINCNGLSNFILLLLQIIIYGIIFLFLSKITRRIELLEYEKIIKSYMKREK